MSNNAPDYEDNLAFPPRHDKMALELKDTVSALESELKTVCDKCFTVFRTKRT